LTWPGVLWAFRSGYASNWHPLTWISHMVDCQFYGVNPAGHHLINLLFHIANTLLLFLLLQRMTGPVWRSVCVAALFAWHPLHVESVAWVAERKDVLSALFWLLTMNAYIRWTRRRDRASYALTSKFTEIARVEVLSDQNNANRFGATAFADGTTNQTVKEFTLTHKTMLTASMGTRLEFRHDWSNEASFARSNGSAVRNQNTISADWFVTF